MRFSNLKIQVTLGWILLIGTLLSALFVLYGGSLYLFRHGSDNLQTGLLQSIYPSSFSTIWSGLFAFSPLAIIEAGLIILVATQLLRVFLLGLFYTLQRDYTFSAICLFILSVLIYSSFWRV